MSYIQSLDKSAQLTQGLAERLGVDLTDPLIHDPETATRVLRRLVLNCMSCEEQGDCAERQAEHAAMDAPPAYCRNMDFWNRS